MKLQTRSFGEIEIAETDILAFDEGLPGFPDDKRFVLLTEEDSPISFLQSVCDGETSFVVVDMAEMSASYDPHVDESLIESLGEYTPENFIVYNICTIHEDLKKTTVNLKAPIIINAVDKKGKQVVCHNEEYSVKQLLFAPSETEGSPC